MFLSHPIHIPYKHEKEQAGAHLNVVIWCESFRQLILPLWLLSTLTCHLKLEEANSSVWLWSIQYQCVTGKLKSHRSQKCKSARPPKSTESFFFSPCAFKCGQDNITSFVSGKSFFLLIPKILSLFQLLLQKRIAFLNTLGFFWAFLSWLNKNSGVQKFCRILPFYNDKVLSFYLSFS